MDHPIHPPPRPQKTSLSPKRIIKQGSSQSRHSPTADSTSRPLAPPQTGAANPPVDHLPKRISLLNDQRMPTHPSPPPPTTDLVPPEPASDTASALMPSEEPRPPRLLDRIRHAIRMRHYSIRTEDTYVDWARRYILFSGKRHPATMGAAEVQAFLTHLATERHVAPEPGEVGAAASLQGGARARPALARGHRRREGPPATSGGAHSVRSHCAVAAAVRHPVAGRVAAVRHRHAAARGASPAGAGRRVPPPRDRGPQWQGRKGPGDGAAREPHAAVARAAGPYASASIRSTSAAAPPRPPCPSPARAAPPPRAPSRGTGPPARPRSRSTARPARSPSSRGRPACGSRARCP
jgi:hypothetical protein